MATKKKIKKTAVKKKGPKVLSPLAQARKELNEELKKAKANLKIGEKANLANVKKAYKLRVKAAELEDKARELEQKACELEQEAYDLENDEEDVCDLEYEVGDIESRLEQLDEIDPDEVMPRTGKIIGYKKVMYGTGNRAIAKLEIPGSAKRNQDFEDDLKCRCSEAKVLGILDLYGHTLPKNTVFKSLHDASFVYKVGATVKPKNGFDMSKAA